MTYFNANVTTHYSAAGPSGRSSFCHQHDVKRHWGQSWVFSTTVSYFCILNACKFYFKW